TGAPLDTTGVVGDDRAVRAVTDELLEARGSHRRAEDEARALVARGVGHVDVVRQCGAGDIERVGGRLGHLCSFVRILSILTGALLGTHRPAGSCDRPISCTRDAEPTRGLCTSRTPAERRVSAAHAPA